MGSARMGKSIPARKACKGCCRPRRARVGPSGAKPFSARRLNIAAEAATHKAARKAGWKPALRNEVGPDPNAKASGLPDPNRRGDLSYKTGTPWKPALRNEV